MLSLNRRGPSQVRLSHHQGVWHVNFFPEVDACDGAGHEAVEPHPAVHRAHAKCTPLNANSAFESPQRLKDEIFLPDALRSTGEQFDKNARALTGGTCVRTEVGLN